MSNSVDKDLIAATDRFIAYIELNTYDSVRKELISWVQSMGFNDFKDYLISLAVDLSENSEAIAKKQKRASLDPSIISSALYQSKHGNQTLEVVKGLPNEQFKIWIESFCRFQQLNLSFIEDDEHQSLFEKYVSVSVIYAVHKRQLKNANLSEEDLANTGFANILKTMSNMINKFMLQLNHSVSSKAQSKPFLYNPFDTDEKFRLMIVSLERLKYLSGSSDFFQDLSKSLKLSEIRKLKWEKSSTELLALFYFIYNGEIFKGEAIFDIIPKLFLDKNDSLFDALKLRKSIAPLRNDLQHHDKPNHGTSNTIKIKNILQDLDLI